MLSLSLNKEDGVVESLNSTLKYLDGVTSPHFGDMSCQIYPTELQLNKLKPLFLELNLDLSITNVIVPSKKIS